MLGESPRYQMPSRSILQVQKIPLVANGPKLPLAKAQDAAIAIRIAAVRSSRNISAHRSSYPIFGILADLAQPTSSRNRILRLRHYDALHCCFRAF